MAIVWSAKLLERYIAPGITKFDQAEIPDLRQTHNQHSYWLVNHFLNSSITGEFTAPVRQFAFNAIYRVQTAFKDYHEARELTFEYLKVTQLGNPTIGRYFSALARWEACYLNWAILVDIFCEMTGTKVFSRADGSPDQRAYDISNAVKHCGDAIKQGKHGADLTVPLWLENQGFRSREHAVSYLEFADLMSQAAQFADALQDPMASSRATAQT